MPWASVGCNLVPRVFSFSNMAAVGENPAGKREDAGGEVEAAGKTGFSHQKLYLAPRLRGIKQIVIALNLS